MKWYADQFGGRTDPAGSDAVGDARGGHQAVYCQQLEPDPIDENAVALFLCDENQGGLTDEQRAFARERREEVFTCYERVVFRILLWAEMSRLGIVSGLEEYCRVFLPLEGSLWQRENRPA